MPIRAVLISLPDKATDTLAAASVADDGHAPRHDSGGKTGYAVARRQAWKPNPEITMDVMTRSEIRIETVTGADLRRHLPRLGQLRSEVFRAWPYLYEADISYEGRYAETYAACPRAGLVLAWAADTIVGAATCIPLADEDAETRAPFLACGYDLHRFFYFGESVLLPAWRGIGIGVDFFRSREAHALSVSDADFACFCAVQRPDTHPARPANATTLEGFWQRRGYTRRPELLCTMSWRDVGDADETPKKLMFWMKSLRGAPLP